MPPPPITAPPEPRLDSTLHGYPPALLDVTLDQLRTLLAVHATRSALRAARALGREQSSVQKQLDTLNRHFQALCGEVLVTRQGRGKDFLFTTTGRTIVDVARATLDEWQGTVDSVRRRVGATLTVGTTEFALHFLSQATARLGDRIGGGVDFRVSHVRTRDFWTYLEAKQVDLLIGSVVTPAGEPAGGGAYDTIELRRGVPVLLTNMPDADLPSGPVGLADLGALPLLLPAAGMVADLLAGWYGADFRGRLNVVAEIDDLRYGTALLRSRLATGCVIVPRGLGLRIRDDPAEAAGDLRVIEIRRDPPPPLEIVSAVFARKGERERYGAAHPLNVLWDALRAEAGDAREYRLSPGVAAAGTGILPG